MRQRMKEQVREYRRKRRFRSRWAKLLVSMACLVVFCTTYALVLPAVTLENKDAVTIQMEETVYGVSLHEDPASAGTVQVDLAQDAHIRLEAGESADSYQWQIRSPESGAWLDIYGDDTASCEIYYAKLAGMQSGSNAELRAVAIVDGTEQISDTVSVSVQDFPENTVEEEPVILDPGSDPLGDVSGEAKSETGPVAQAEIESRSDAESEPKIEVQSEVGGESQTEVEPEAEAELLPEAESEAGAEPQTEAGPETDTGAETESQSENDVQSEDETSIQNGEEISAFSLDGQESRSQNEPGTGEPDAGILPADDGDGTDEGDTEPDTTTKYTVRINYVRETDTGAVSVADPWWATFSASGETGSYQVNFAVVQGYKVKAVYASDGSTPNLVHGEDETTIIGLHLPEKVYGDLIYSVEYEADTVSYTVHHWLQNLTDPDTYTMQENDTETKTGLTGTLLTSDAKTYEGFRQVAYAYPTLAGDGTTVIDIKYDRNYYKIDFELNGGEGVNGIYVAYGADLSALTTADMTTPTRTGYKFTGWYTDADCTQAFDGSFPGTMPAQNAVYYAGWEATETYYSVAVWVESLTEGEYDFLCSFDEPAMTGTVVGYDDEIVSGVLNSIQNNSRYEGYQPALKYFTLNNDKSETGITVNGDGSSVVNVYYTRNSYTLRFVYGRSYTQRGTTSYQMSSSNHGYSLHQLPSGGGMTGYDLSTGCNWGNATNTGFSISSSYQNLINNKPDVLRTGSMQQTSNYTTYTYYYIDLTAKYGADIFDYWPVAGCVSKSGVSVIDWGTQYDSDYRKTYAADGSSNAEPNIHPYYRVMDEFLINTDNRRTSDVGVTHTLVAYTSSNQIYTWEYTPYYEALQSEIDDSSVTKVTYNGTQYVQGSPVMVYTTQTDHSVDYVSVVANQGFVTPSKEADTLVAGQKRENGDTIYTLALYYNRERYSITFHNGYWGTKVIESIPYGELLAGYEGTATCGYTAGGDDTSTWEEEINLSTVEPLLANRVDPNFEAKYEFGGKWYTAWSETAGSGYGEKFDLTDTALTMPQSNLILYPEWTPKTYTATFFWESPDSNTTGAGVLYDPVKDLELPADTVTGVPVQTFTYGGTLTAPTPDPAYGSLEFLYWTYYVFTRDYETTDGSGLRFEAGDSLHFPGTVSTERANEIITGLLKLEDCPIKEQRLEFGTTSFYEDVYIYGHWNTIVYVPYTVHYVLLDEGVDEDTPIARVEDGMAYDADGNEIGVQIADDDTDNVLAGETVTLAARVDDELYEQYQPTADKACYPIGSSTHSLVMDVSQESMEYTFVYKQTNPVTYKVQYLTPELDENGDVIKNPDDSVKYTELRPSVEIDSTQSIVTENSVYVPGYTLTPDPYTGERDYQITRILSYADPDDDGGTVITPENTITFYYTLDSAAKEYKVEYYYQQLDGSYAKHETEMTFQGTVGETYTAQEILMPGWWCDRSVPGTNERQMLPDSGMTLKLYYSAYPVTITKVWADTVSENEKKAVNVSVYTAIQQTDNSYKAETVSDGSMASASVTLNNENNWQRTIYLPYPEYLKTSDDPVVDDAVEPYTDRFYAALEENALNSGYLVSYSDSTEIFVSNDKTVGGKVNLTKDAINVAEVTVTNSPAVELPNTGGSGINLYTYSGLLLMAAAVMHGYTLRRKRERRVEN